MAAPETTHVNGLDLNVISEQVSDVDGSMVVESDLCCKSEDAPVTVNNKELLHQNLLITDPPHAFESSTVINDASLNNQVAQVADTGQENGNHIMGSVEIENQSAESILHHNASTIFSNANQDTLLQNDSSVVLDMDTTEGYSVTSIPEGHIISIPNDMISDSAIITENGEETLQNAIEISDGSAAHLLQDQTGNHQVELDPHIESTEFVHQADTNTHEVLPLGESFPHAITLTAPSGLTMTPEVLQSVLQQVQAQQLAQQQQQQTLNVEESVTVKEEPTTEVTDGVSSFSSQSVNFSEASSGGQNDVSDVSASVTAKPEEASTEPAPPLGSSQNPIRIIQQGNRYTPMQQLTTEQMQQIMQVVQQQHVNKNMQDPEGAIIFNPQTNTRIMYRVIYPSELHKSQSASEQTTYQVVRPSTASQEQQTAGLTHQRRPYRRRKDLTGGNIPPAEGEQEGKDKEEGDGSELSKEEKEARKKHRPRTRSGRVSKPPKHMVQDYKHIHVLDWDEDYDDSDGGYSDYKHSDEEGHAKSEAGDVQQSTSPDLFSEGGLKPKNHKCQTCDKSYIGQAGLARHYRLNPDHCVNPSEDGSVSSLQNGFTDGDDSKDTPLVADNGVSDSALDTTATTTVPGGHHSGSTNLETFSEDSNTQDSLNSTGTPSPHTVLASSIPTMRGRGRGKFRGRWAHLKYNAHMRRKNKLKEIIKQCNDEDLMEVVLPRLVTSISLWEFLLMKSEKGGTSPQIDTMYEEFKALSHHVRQVCSSFLQLLTQEEVDKSTPQCKLIKVTDKKLATCLDLEQATYRVKQTQTTELSLHSDKSHSVSLQAEPLGGLVGFGIMNDGRQKRTIDYVDEPVEGETLCNASKRPNVSMLPLAMSNPSFLPVRSHIPSHGTSPKKGSILKDALSLPSPDTSFMRTDVKIISPFNPSESPPTSQPNRVSSSLTSSSSIPPLPSSLLPTPSSKPNSNTRISIQPSPFVHISCPSTTHPGASSHTTSPTENMLVGSSSGNTVLVSNAVSSFSPMKLKTLNPPPNNAQSSCGDTEAASKFVLPRQSVLSLPQQSAGPGTALLLAAGAAVGNSNILVKSLFANAESTQKVMTNNLLHSPSSSTSINSSPSASVPLSVTSTRSVAVVVTKPTEVNVSRQLFHNTTLSPSQQFSGPVSTLTNGKLGSLSPKAPLLVSNSTQPIPVQISPADTNKHATENTVTLPSSISSSNITTKTSPISHLVPSPNKPVSADANNEDILAADIVSTGSVSQFGLELSLGNEQTSVLTSTPQSDNITESVDTSLGTAYLNNHSPFVMADNVHSHSAQPKLDIKPEIVATNAAPDVSTPNDTTLILNSTDTKPANIYKLKQDNLNTPQTAIHDHNRAETNSPPELNYLSQEPQDTLAMPLLPANAETSVVSPIPNLANTNQFENSLAPINDIPVEQEIVTGNPDTEENPDSSQLPFLTDGASIYQTEDGTFFIQSSNGNTFQLQGTQGLSLEALQALLSGSLDQIVT